MSNYPMGAQYDSRAPYNEKIKKVQVCVSFTCYKYIDLEVEGPYCEETLKQLADEETYRERRELWANDWEEDEFTVIEN
jgi:hypothetical protein